jgi:hypothetical protein
MSARAKACRAIITPAIPFTNAGAIPEVSVPKPQVELELGLLLFSPGDAPDSHVRASLATSRQTGS